MGMGVVLGGLVVLGCAAPEGDGAVDQAVAAASNHDFDVDFTGCAEFVGIGTVPAANARPLVPAHYTLAGDASDAIIVVRIASCAGAAVDGHDAVATRVSQIGISVTGQDTTADINNYQLWYVTDQGLLNGRFTAEGVDVDVDQHITFAFTANSGAGGGGTLAIGTSPPKAPPYQGSGPAAAPTAAPVTFVASWWFDGKKGIVRSRTVFPAIRFGSATMTLTTPAGSALAQLIGGTSLTFPLLDSYNTFPAAPMEVRAVP